MTLLRSPSIRQIAEIGPHIVPQTGTDELRAILRDEPPEHTTHGRLATTVAERTFLGRLRSSFRSSSCQAFNSFAVGSASLCCYRPARRHPTRVRCFAGR